MGRLTPAPNFSDSQTLARSFPPAGVAPSFFHFHPRMEAMDETPEDSLPISANSISTDVAGYRPRGYQLEMLEASQQHNIIVAVGSSVGVCLIDMLC